MDTSEISEADEGLSRTTCCASVSYDNSEIRVKLDKLLLRPYDFTESEKEEVLEFFKSIDPEFDRSEFYFCSDDVPPELDQEIFFLSRDQSAIRQDSLDLLRVAREYKAGLPRSEDRAKNEGQNQ